MANSFRWTFFLDSQGHWRWKRKASTAQTLAYSEGFPNKADCINNARNYGYVANEVTPPLSNDPFSDVRRPDVD